MVSKDHISRAGRRASLALATSDDAGTSSLFHDIEAQKRQALDVARTAIISAEVARWAAVRLSRVRYAAALVVLEVGVIAARLFSDDVTDWPLGLIVVISSCEMALLISMLIAAWLSSHKLRWASDGLTVVTYLVGIVLVPSLSIASGERPGTFSLFVLTLIVYAYPKAFVTPAAYVDVGFVAVIVVMVISTVSQLLSTGVAYETFANGVIVLNFALASFIPQRQNQVMRHELVRLFATMEMESHTQLLLLQRVIPRVFLAELIKDERIVSTAKRVAVLFCEVMAPDHAQGDGLHKLGNNVHSGTLRTLSRVFKVIDGVMDRHGVFKVETIGSEYMAVSGLPVQCLHPRNPVFALIRASTDMLDAVHDDPICRAKGITLQIGINSGTTVEAILGRRLLPRWKLFGDTVNTASRIKSAGAPGLIHLSAAARKLLLDDVRGFCAVAEPGLVAYATADLARHGALQKTESGLEEPLHMSRRRRGSDSSRSSQGSSAGAERKPEFRDNPKAATAAEPTLSGLDGLWGDWPSMVRTHDLKGATPDPEHLAPAEDGVDRLSTTSVRPEWSDVLLARLAGIALVPRPTIWCKGKGVMQTYIVDLKASDKLRLASRWHGHDTLGLRKHLRKHLLSPGKVNASRSVAIEALGGGAAKRRAPAASDKHANIGQIRMLKQVSQIAETDATERDKKSRMSMRESASARSLRRSSPSSAAQHLHPGTTQGVASETTAATGMLVAPSDPQPLPEPTVHPWTLQYLDSADVLEPMYRAHHAAHATHLFPIGVFIVASISLARFSLLISSDTPAALLELFCALVSLACLPVGSGSTPQLLQLWLRPGGVLSCCRPSSAIRLTEEFIVANKGNAGISELVSQLIHGVSGRKGDILSSGLTKRLDRQNPQSNRSGSSGSAGNRARVARASNSSLPDSRGERHFGNSTARSPACCARWRPTEPETLYDGVLLFTALQLLSAGLSCLYVLTWTFSHLRVWADPPFSKNTKWPGALEDNSTEMFQFQGALVLVMVIAPSLLGMRSLVLLMLSPPMVAAGVIGTVVQGDRMWGYGVAWVIATSVLSIVLVREFERSRRFDFFTNYVAREGQRITEGMLHAMLPKGIADSMLNRGGTQRALARLAAEILSRDSLCGLAGAAAGRTSQHPRRDSQASDSHISVSDAEVVSEMSAFGRASSAFSRRMLPPARVTESPRETRPKVIAGVGVPDDIAEEILKLKPPPSQRRGGPNARGGGVVVHTASGQDGSGSPEAPTGQGVRFASSKSIELEGKGARIPGGGSTSVRDTSGRDMSLIDNTGHVIGLNRAAGSMYEPSMNQVALLMFDLVGFTKLSQAIGPHKLVMMLDELYDMFDKMVERRGAYKVETIGDAFLVCCGAPDPRPAADAAVRVTKCALDMMQRLRTFKAPGGRALQARVGIHVGPVLSGVIGTQMPRYQLFGPQVDYVMEVESTSLPNRVHASAELLDVVRDVPDITIDERLPDGTGFVSRNRAARLYTPW